MSINLENMFNEIQQQGLNSAKGGTLSGVFTFSGANTHSGANTFSSTNTFTGATTFSGATSIVSKTTNSALAGATVALLASQSGQVFINVSTSGSPSWTLPAAANGLEYTFICGNTTAGFTITTGTAAVIHAKTSASGTAITSTATTGAITNTQATAVVGDFLSLVCDGTNWWPTAQSGTFAAS